MHPQKTPDEGRYTGFSSPIEVYWILFLIPGLCSAPRCRPPGAHRWPVLASGRPPAATRAAYSGWKVCVSPRPVSWLVSPPFFLFYGSVSCCKNNIDTAAIGVIS